MNKITNTAIIPGIKANKKMFLYPKIGRSKKAAEK